MIKNRINETDYLFVFIVGKCGDESSLVLVFRVYWYLCVPIASPTIGHLPMHPLTCRSVAEDMHLSLSLHSAYENRNTYAMLLSISLRAHSLATSLLLSTMAPVRTNPCRWSRTSTNCFGGFRRYGTVMGMSSVVQIQCCMALVHPKSLLDCANTALCQLNNFFTLRRSLSVPGNCDWSFRLNVLGSRFLRVRGWLLRCHTSDYLIHAYVNSYFSMRHSWV